jgi:NAD-dependent DNA ligase
LSKFLEKASKAYYEGNPIISDAEYDSLADQLGFERVGYQVTDGLPHKFQMYSLQKCFDIDEAPLDIDQCVETPKLDGAAVSVLYVQGELALALTRGDGKIGRDITEKMRCLVPELIELEGIVQITGEVVAPASIENSRNFASGSLNLKDLEEFKTRPLTFVAYGVQGVDLSYTYYDSMNILGNKGFQTAVSFDCSNYPTDGIVYRLDDNKEFRKLGYTANHPRGAFALKEQQDGVVTTLLDVEWQVGKSGVVSPVAILEPVLIGDAMVSRATLHNIEYIQELHLELGCSVEVIRSGEIIPRIVRRV